LVAESLQSLQNRLLVAGKHGTRFGDGEASMVALEEPALEMRLERAETMACTGQRHMPSAGSCREASCFCAMNNQPDGDRVNSGEIQVQPCIGRSDGRLHGCTKIWTTPKDNVTSTTGLDSFRISRTGQQRTMGPREAEDIYTTPCFLAPGEQGDYEFVMFELQERRSAKAESCRSSFGDAASHGSQARERTLTVPRARFGYHAGFNSRNRRRSLLLMTASGLGLCGIWPMHSNLPFSNARTCCGNT
jgi:hypothetical protein